MNYDFSSFSFVTLVSFCFAYMLTQLELLYLIRQRGLSGKSQVVDGNKKTRTRERAGRAFPAPEANAEIQSNLDVRFSFSCF